MITRYVADIPVDPNHKLFADSAYRLYAYLLEQLPTGQAQELHESEVREIRQNLQYHRNLNCYHWTLNILSDEMTDVLCPALDNLHELQIEHHIFPITRIEKYQIALSDLLQGDVIANRMVFSFYTPTAFKQGGRYTILPQERLILQSLMFSWNAAFPLCPLTDSDAFEALLAGIHIVDYQLKTMRFQLKGIRIPGFIGTCTIEAKLAPPLLALWNSLTRFADFAGIGIKTGIGMGGTHVTC